jgi:hypothetical protein
MDKLRFRLYSPTNPSLREYADPINVEPVDVLHLVETIVEESKASAPHLPETQLALVPRRMDGDLKRLMKPQIDELLEETKDALIRLRPSGKRRPADQPPPS